MSEARTERVLAARRRMMAIRGFLCQNVAIGCAFGAFGMTVLPMQQKFGIGRGMATMGLALAVLVMGLAGPLFVGLMGRIGLRRTMIGGIVLSGLGYVALAFAPNIWVVLFCQAIPIGLGLALFGALPASILASSWFRPNPGPALGFVNTPLFLAIIPLLAVPILRWSSMAGLNLALAGLHLALLPFAWGIADAAPPPHGSRPPEASASSAILARPIFWAIVLGGGLLNAVGIVSVSHVVAFAIERAIPAAQAALLLAVMGSANIVGSLSVGYIGGRLGPSRTLAAIGLLIAAGWAVMLQASALWPMIAMTVAIGAGGAAVFPMVNMVTAEAFGAHNHARAMGLFGLMRLPITFCLPPLAGVLHDAASGYGAVLATIIAMCAGCAALFAILRVEPSDQPSEA